MATRNSTARVRRRGPHGAPLAVVAGLLATGVVAGEASGQAYLGGAHPYSPEYLAGSAWDRLEPIDPGGGDLGPLGLQVRVLPTPMQHDRGFGVLYRAMAPDGSPIFARRDGGITAVFPRSAYVSTPIGTVSLIPPGTRFIIGEPPIGASSEMGLSGRDDAPRDPSNGLRLDGRLSGQEFPETPAGDAERSPRLGVRALLKRAARRERAGG